jgi:hypothetical protein
VSVGGSETESQKDAGLLVGILRRRNFVNTTRINCDKQWEWQLYNIFPCETDNKTEEVRDCSLNDIIIACMWTTCMNFSAFLPILNSLINITGILHMTNIVFFSLCPGRHHGIRFIERKTPSPSPILKLDNFQLLKDLARYPIPYMSKCVCKERS